GSSRHTHGGEVRKTARPRAPNRPGGDMRSDGNKKLLVAAAFLAVIAVPVTQLLSRIAPTVGEVQPAWAATTTTTTLPPLDHFECYELKPGFFVNQSATVQDQFGMVTEMVRFPHTLCNPTNKNGEGIHDSTDHLAGHLVKAPKFTKRTNQTVTNQFGTAQIDVVRPDLLMVPTSKDGVPIVTPIDHFQCYKVKRSKGTPKFATKTVTITNQFEPNVTLTIVKPVRLCAPANKNNEDPLAPGHPEHLVCYKTKGTPFGQQTHGITNQFGFEAVTVIKRK